MQFVSIYATLWLMFCLRMLSTATLIWLCRSMKNGSLGLLIRLDHTTGTCLSLNLFKIDSEQIDWDFNQKVTLSARDFWLLCQNIEK